MTTDDAMGSLNHEDTKANREGSTINRDGAMGSLKHEDTKANHEVNRDDAMGCMDHEDARQATNTRS